MKKLIRLSYLLMVVFVMPHLTSCKEEPTMKFSVLVVDNEGKPIPNCEAGAIILKDMKFQRSAKMTDKHGIAYYELKTPNSRLAMGAKAPEGYYRTLGEEFFYDPPKSGIWQPENKQFKVVLKKKKNPIPMYAKKGPEKLPVRGVNLGYDLEIGDWIAPHGEGKKSDIIFKLEADEVSSKEFSSVLSVTFPNEGDGLIPFEVPIESEMKSLYRSDYKAPLEGYVNNLIHSWIRKPRVSDKNTRKRTMNYYIRVRTKLDGVGNVVSAHYGKIYGDFMRFNYYLNPTPNDKNVEFDPKKNLFKVERGEIEVQQP